MCAIEEIDVRRALRVKASGDILRLIEEVGEEVPSVACLFRHLIRRICGIVHRIVRTHRGDRDTLWNVGPTDVGEFVPNVLYKRTVIANEHDKERFANRVLVTHAKPAWVGEFEVGAGGSDLGLRALQWRHGLYRTGLRARRGYAWRVS